MHRRHTAVSHALAASVLLLAGCASASGTSAAAPDDATALPSVAEGSEPCPSMTFPDTEPPAQSTSEVVSEGDGPVVTSKDVVVVDYVGQVWGGDVFINSCESGAPLVQEVSALVPEWEESIRNATVGSRILLSMPPSDDADAGQVSGVADTDTMVFVADIVARYGADARGQADAVPDAAAAAGVAPQVIGDLGGEAALSLPAGVDEPAEVVTTVLARGTGAPVREGSLVGQYAGVDWMGGSVGSSWQTGTPKVFPVAADVPTFAGLIGVPLGSRVLLMEPATAASPAVAIVMDLIAQP